MSAVILSPRLDPFISFAVVHVNKYQFEFLFPKLILSHDDDQSFLQQQFRLMNILCRKLPVHCTNETAKKRLLILRNQWICSIRYHLKRFVISKYVEEISVDDVGDISTDDILQRNSAGTTLIVLRHTPFVVDRTADDDKLILETGGPLLMLLYRKAYFAPNCDGGSCAMRFNGFYLAFFREIVNKNNFDNKLKTLFSNAFNVIKHLNNLTDRKRSNSMSIQAYRFLHYVLISQAIDTTPLENYLGIIGIDKSFPAGSSITIPEWIAFNYNGEIETYVFSIKKATAGTLPQNVVNLYCADDIAQLLILGRDPALQLMILTDCFKSASLPLHVTM